MEAARSSETSIYNKSTRRHITEDGILHIWYKGRNSKYIYLYILQLSKNKIIVLVYSP
jgi:hypothetical protein